VAASPRRTISDAHGTEELPGEVRRAEGADPTGDAAVDEAYDGLGATWRLYSDVYGRDSLDGAGLPLDGTVHYGQDYDNAFWDGSRMVFGDGDGVLFNRFTVAIDVVGHELTHGVTEKTANLRYEGQSGALNESVSDVFGSLVKQRELRQDAAAADWLIGAGLFTASVRGEALRSMKAPGSAYDDPRLGKDPQPATMSGYVDTSDDNGGVHINSGIPNHAFYLLAVAIGGNAWEQAGQVWYDVLTGGGLASDADFAAFAAATVAAAGARFGDGSSQQQAVAAAWAQVEVVVPQQESTQPRSPAQRQGRPQGRPGGEPAPEPAGAPTVVVVRSGGIAGLRQERQLPLAELPEEEARRWYDLLDSGRLMQLDPFEPAPDRFVYRVSAPGLEVTAAEHQLPDDVRGLLDETLRRR
jgi:Zn-dependent metalloprotease